MADERIIWSPLPGSQTLAMSCPAQIIIYHGTRGPGKQIANEIKVLCDSGIKRAGDITYDDKLVAMDGSYCDILGIYQHKDHKLYNVEFHDGEIIQAGAEHRWLTLNSKTGYREGWKVRTTEQLMNMKISCSVPYMQGPIPGKQWCGLDPYMIGYIIANGTTGSKNITIYSIDEEILQYAKSALGWNLYYGEQTAKRAVCPSNQDELWREVLESHKIGDEKCVPKSLIESDSETRLSVLQGLMDGDGNHEKGAQSRYSTVSEQLAKDVVYLVKSLGGWASYRKQIFNDEQQSKRIGNKEGSRNWIYRVNISHHNQFNPFRLERKASLYQKQKKFLTRGIKSITPSKIGNAVCFAVDHPSHCFVIGDFVVTHNTDSQLMRFRGRVGQGYGRHWRGIILDREYKNLDDLVSKSLRWFPEFHDGCRFINSKSDYKWIWKTGEELLFRTVKKDQDYWGFHGQEFPYIGWNELTKFPTGNLFDSMASCNRSSFRPEDFPFWINGKLFDEKGQIQYVPEKHKFARIQFLPEIPLETFATCNPNGCVPFGEVLTTLRGWIPIQDVKENELILSVDENGVAKNTFVSNVIKKHWEGTMIKKESRGIYMEFTDDHRLPLLSTDLKSFSLREFKDLPNDTRLKRCPDSWKGHNLLGFKVPKVETRKRKLNQPSEVSIEDYSEFIGWFLSEGFTLARDKMVGISQTKPENRVLIADLLTRMGFNFRSTFQNFTFYCPDWFAYLEQFGKCRDKFIPTRLKQANTEVLQILFDTLMKGDGSNGVYYTLSKQLADDISEIAVKLGNRVYISTRKNGKCGKPGVSVRGIKDELTYQVSTSKATPLSLKTGNSIYKNVINKDSDLIKTEYSGLVYCLTVPETETFFIRQNGCVWLSGNSGHNWVKKRFINASPMGKILTHSINVFNPKTQKREDVAKTQVHIFGSYRENKYLSPEYVATLESITEPNKRRAWLMGDWDVVAGGMFDDLWDSKQHVVTPFKIPREWRIDRSFDWGSSKPFSVGWWAESNGCDVTLADGSTRRTVAGDVFRIDEYYGCVKNRPNEGLRMLGEEIAKEIIKRELEMGIYNRVHPGPADNSIYDVENGNSIAASMRKPVNISGTTYAGVEWIRSDKSSGSRIAGWEKMRLYLKQALRQYRDYVKKGPIIVPDLSSEIPREFPGLFVFNNCKDFIDLVPVLPRDEDNPDDVDTDSEDHIGDEARYKLLSIGIGAKGGRTTGTQ